MERWSEVAVHSFQVSALSGFSIAYRKLSLVFLLIPLQFSFFFILFLQFLMLPTSFIFHWHFFFLFFDYFPRIFFIFLFLLSLSLSFLSFLSKKHFLLSIFISAHHFKIVLYLLPLLKGITIPFSSGIEIMRII